MASNPNSASELIALARQRSYQPANGGPTAAAMLRDLNAEMLTTITPILTKMGEEFFVEPHEFTLIQGQRAYDIPADSIGVKVRDVQLLADDNVSWLSLAHEEPERAASYVTTDVKPKAYIIRANTIEFVSKPANSTQEARIMYYRRPRQIVDSGYSVCSSVTGPSGGTYTVNVASTTGMATGLFDIIDATTHARISESLQGTVASGTTLTFAAAGLDSDQIAALVASAGATFIGHNESPSADLPPEAGVLLAQRVACIVLQEQASPRVAAAFSEYERIKQGLKELFSPRAAGRQRKIVNRQGPGWGAWRWGYRTSYLGGG